MPISSAPQRLRQEDQVFEASLRQFEDNPVRKDGREGGKEKKQSSVLYQNTFFFLIVLSGVHCGTYKSS
jgi:hypothetical protein